MPDPEMIGHCLRIPAKSSRAPISFAAVARDRNGKQVWVTVGSGIGIDQARDLARDAIRRIKDGRAASETAEPTVRAVADEWMERHVGGNKLRSARESGRIIERYIIPHIGKRVFADMRRKDIAELLDRIEDDSGKHMADGVLKTFRAISKWVHQR
jgi:hypothetical protein